jgi:hypothetical protein
LCCPAVFSGETHIALEASAVGDRKNVACAAGSVALFTQSATAYN